MQVHNRLEDVNRLKSLVDLAVYTKDREMRLAGSTNFGKTSILKPLRDDVSYSDTVITWLDPRDQRVEISVPVHDPTAVKKQKLGGTPTPRRRSAEIQCEDSEVRLRILELVQDKVSCKTT